MGEPSEQSDQVIRQMGKLLQEIMEFDGAIRHHVESKETGAQQLQVLMKDVAALEQGLCQLQVLQEQVKKLLAASHADMIAVLEEVKQQEETEGPFASPRERESRRLRVAVRIAGPNMSALERAFLQLRSAHTYGTALAEKVVKRAVSTQATPGAEGTYEIILGEADVAVLKKTVKGLLAVQANSIALDEAVEEFTESAYAVMGTGKTQ